MTRNKSCLRIMFLWFVPFLASCDLFDPDSQPLPTSVFDMMTMEASNARVTQTAAPRQTWTAQANATLTQLPTSEAQTRQAMDATLAAEATMTAQLVTREAQTVAANLTGTARARLVTPTRTATLLPTATPSATIVPTSLPTPPPTVAAGTVFSPTIVNTIATRLPLDQIFQGNPIQNPRANLTDPTGIYKPDWVDFLKRKSSTFLLNTWASSDLVLTVATNRFESVDDARGWQELTNEPGSTSGEADAAIVVNGGEGFDEIRCKKGTRTSNGRQFGTAYCDIFRDNVHVGFNFLTPNDIDEVMSRNAGLIISTVEKSLE